MLGIGFANCFQNNGGPGQCCQAESGKNADVVIGASEHADHSVRPRSQSPDPRSKRYSAEPEPSPLTPRMTQMEEEAAKTLNAQKLNGRGGAESVGSTGSPGLSSLTHDSSRARFQDASSMRNYPDSLRDPRDPREQRPPPGGFDSFPEQPGGYPGGGYDRHSPVFRDPYGLESERTHVYDRYPSPSDDRDSTQGMRPDAGAVGFMERTQGLSSEQRDMAFQARMREIANAAKAAPDAGGTNLPPLHRSARGPGSDSGSAGSAGSAEGLTVLQLQARLDEVEARARHYEEHATQLMKLTEADNHVREYAQKSLTVAETRAKSAEDKASVMSSRMMAIDSEYEKLRQLMYQKEHELEMMKADAAMKEAQKYPPFAMQQRPQPPEQHEAGFLSCVLPRRMCN